MKVAYIQRSNKERDFVLSHLQSSAEVNFFETIEDISQKEAEETEILSLFFKQKLDAEEISKFPSLKMIAVRSTGFDNIDTEACKEKGVIVTNVPTYGEHTVAEYTFGLILTLSRKIYSSCKKTKETGIFSREGLRGTDLHGKRLGIIGTGKIGTNVARIAKGFGMEVLATDPFPKEELAEDIGFEYKEFNSLIQESDIITLHAPLNEHTRHLINNENIKTFKGGSMLINTSRGGLIQTEAIIKGLEEDILKGVALDVMEKERLLKKGETCLSDNVELDVELLKAQLCNQFLIKHPKVLVTPHNAFNTKEAFRRIQETTVENIINFIKGTPTNTV
ncbi:MAG: NAD(P)-dependent oxidoreductase [Patescibacteria group bacterium]